MSSAPGTTRRLPARAPRPAARGSRPPSRAGRPPAGRSRPAHGSRPRAGGTVGRRPAGHTPVGRALGWLAAVAALVLVAVLATHRDDVGTTPIAGLCTVAGSDLTLTTAQAANASTIAAVARSRGLPPRATVIALATVQQESRLRNLDHGDRDSLGLFQQRPSQGWGSEAQVQDPVYATGKFLDGLVEVRRWEAGRLTEVSQAVQRSGFPEAYQQWEPMAQTLTDALLADSPAALSCTYSPPNATGPIDDRAAAVADVVRREAGTPGVQPDGVISVASAGWPEATWAVAHAERLQLTEVVRDGWRWTPDGGWLADTATAGAPLTLQLAG